MAEIVAFPADPASLSHPDLEDVAAHDRFLVDEGLELLADYRSIADVEVRASVRRLIRSIVDAQQGRVTSA